ncbi:hypothetical protein AAFF_G00032940 [Aldrovandia affinis]|uniref:Uncharacterized protein n=1 Tax=Aldrovandia affinis TaxID=143900 RepID=A0AAD7WGP3_9TELE|nr:hypothetical protein AAFF_G00032940 [Aldrovandia affinis]
MATVTTNHPLPDAQQFSSFSELVKATARHLHGVAADEEETPTAEKFKEAELSILRHVVTKLLIRQVDSDLKHPGAERLFAELRRKFWILRGREAIRRAALLPRVPKMESPTSQSQDGGPASCSAQAVSATVFSTGLIALVHCRSRLAVGVRNAGVCFSNV